MSHFPVRSLPLALNRQRGSVLYVGLIILILLTMLGLTSMGSTVLQERMAGNFGMHQVAFQDAEGAMRQQEQLLSDFIRGLGPAAIWQPIDEGNPEDPNSAANWAQAVIEGPRARVANITDEVGGGVNCAIGGGGSSASCPDWVFEVAVAGLDDPVTPGSITVLQSIFVP